MRNLLSQTEAGCVFPETTDFRRLIAAFNYFIPEVLVEIHPEWKYRALDDLTPRAARRTGNREAMFFGLCYLMTNQRLVPVYLRIQIDERVDQVNWFECRVGEQGPHGMLTRSNRTLEKQLMRLEGQEDEIDWAYWVTYGERL